MTHSAEKISVGVFEPINELTGGRAYRQAVRRALEKTCKVEALNISGGGIIPSARLRRLLALSRVKKSKDIWIRDFYSIAGMSLRNGGGKNIALFLHMYEGEEDADLLGRILKKLFVSNIKKCHAVVAIAEFWRDQLLKFQLPDIRIIRYGLDPGEFTFSSAEVEAFKKKHTLGARVVYIGNCREMKGVVEVYEALKDRGYQLVTSGEPEVSLPCLNLNLPYRDYLLLLKSSSVTVTMSKFREGWCITAQEAMLCKTPVIGSGTGGMAELLRGGNQMICPDVRELPALIGRAIEHRQKLGEDGFLFASRFTREKFERAWLDLVEEVMRDDSRLK